MSLRTSLFVLFFITITCVMGIACAEDAAPVAAVATPDAADQILAGIVNLLPESAQKIIATIWTIATALGLLATLAAFVLRAVRGEESKAAWWADTIGYWASKVGTSIRKPRPPVAPEKV